MASIYRKEIIISGKLDDTDFWKAFRSKGEDLDLNGKFNLSTRKRGSVGGTVMGTSEHIQKLVSWIRDQSRSRKNIEIEDVDVRDRGTFDEKKVGEIKGDIELAW